MNDLMAPGLQHSELPVPAVTPRASVSPLPLTRAASLCSS